MAQLTHREPEWIPTAPVVVRQEIRIAAPPAAVWAFIAEHESWPAWFPALQDVVVTGMADRVGGTRDVTTGGITVSEVFTAWDPDERFAFAVVDGPPVLASMAESVEITDADDTGCTVVYTQGLEPARRMGWLVRGAAKRADGAIAAGLAGLRDAVEAAIC